MFSILIDSEAEGFLTSRTFSRALMRFSMRVLEPGSIFVTLDTESQLIEVLFAVAAKIRLEPDILPIWFSGNIRAEAEDGSGKEKRSFVGITQKDDFPLCYMFIDRVHHEGRIGDFARTGLLYVFEAASRSTELEAWLVASDLPTLMASGLGALYSQLNRELSLRQDTDKLPLLLAMSDYTELHPDTAAESAFSKNHAAHIATFLSDLTFWQDILDHCKSVDVRQTLLDHFQILFLQQVLYPSLLQSSDTDQGSSVAVLTYLTDMLQTLSYPELIKMILNYLLAVQEKAPSARPPSPGVVRRKSMLEVIHAPKTEEDLMEPVLFDLVDLIQTGLSSRNQQTVFAALKLYIAISTRHREFALGTLVKVRPDVEEQTNRTIGALHSETESLLALAIAIGGAHRIDEAYAGACLDVQNLLEVQQPESIPTVLSLDPSTLANEPTKSTSRFLLNTHDACFSAMVALMGSFLTNSVETNLGLTEALMSIGTCHDIQLDGWLARLPGDYIFEDDLTSESPLNDTVTLASMDEEERWAYASVKQAQRRPVLDRSSEPSLLSALRSIGMQVNLLRRSYAQFDLMLTKRKTILLGLEKTEEDPFAGMSGHIINPPATPKQISHVRQGSITSSRAVSPARSVNAPRGRVQADQSSDPSRSSSMASRRRSLISPPRTTMSVFRPPPPDSPNSPSRRNFSIDDTASKPDNEATALLQKIQFPLKGATDVVTNSEDDVAGRELKTVSLSHVLTNVVVLQNFMVELVALMQLRASLFEEVRFN